MNFGRYVYKLFPHYERGKEIEIHAYSKEEAVEDYGKKLFPGQSQKVWIYNNKLPEGSNVYPIYFMKVSRGWNFKLYVEELGSEGM
jgi:hypothetical protein